MCLSGPIEEQAQLNPAVAAEIETVNASATNIHPF
jgi:hypothetical protein